LKVNRLLASALALVLTAGLVSPAYADIQSSSSPVDGPSIIRDDIVTALDHDDLIFDGGGPNLVNAFDMTLWVQADDFEFTEDMVLSDVHIWGCDRDTPWDGTIEWWIFDDNAGSPGVIVDQGNGILVDRTFTGETVPTLCPEFVMDFDLDHDVSLDGNVRYWLGLHMADDFSTSDLVAWELTDNSFGSNKMESSGGTFDNWFDPVGGNFAFFLTGHSPIVGGEFLPIESTSLLLAGAQTFSWMIPVVLSVLGIGIFFVSRKSE